LTGGVLENAVDLDQPKRTRPSIGDFARDRRGGLVQVILSSAHLNVFQLEIGEVLRGFTGQDRDLPRAILGLAVPEKGDCAANQQQSAGD
jgi:hypothetical protein